MAELKTAFVEMFGDSPMVRVVDFFLMYHLFDYSKSQVARETGVSRVTIEKIWSALVKNGMIVRTRVMGRAEMYRLNVGDPRVEALMRFDFEISTRAIERDEAEFHEKRRLPVRVKGMRPP